MRWLTCVLLESPHTLQRARAVCLYDNGGDVRRLFDQLLGMFKQSSPRAMLFFVSENSARFDSDPAFGQQRQPQQQRQQPQQVPAGAEAGAAAAAAAAAAPGSDPWHPRDIRFGVCHYQLAPASPVAARIAWGGWPADAYDELQLDPRDEYESSACQHMMMVAGIPEIEAFVSAHGTGSGKATVHCGNATVWSW